MIRRCAWANTDPLMQRYHDDEWAVPLRESRALWECLMLEGFQAGLSWITVLRKRETFRTCFANFEPEKVARFTELDIEALLSEPGIIRSRAKIEATILGARAYLDMRDQGQDFSDFCWAFVDGKPLKGDGIALPTQTPLSAEISKAFKAKGFKFVGPTITYAWMQAVGLVDDHAADCFKRES